MSDDLKVRLVIEALDRATEPLRRIGMAMGGVSNASAGMRVATERLGGLTAAAARYGVVAGAAAATVGGVFLKSVIDTSAQFESFRAQLKSLEGSSEGAEKALAFATQFAQDTPLELAQVVEAYAQLRTYGLTPTDGTLQALTDTMAKQGKGAEQLSGIVTAVGQAWVKQKLQGDEIMQLTERGVPVWDLLAKATGKNVQELQKLSEKGKLGRDVIRALIVEMGKASKGASAEFAKTWVGQVSMLSDSWTQFKLQVGESGPFDATKGALVRLNGALGGSGVESKRLAGIIGGKMTEGIKLAMTEIDGLIKDLGGVEGAARNAGAAFSGAAGALGGFVSLIRDAREGVNAMQDVGLLSKDLGSASFWAGKGPAFTAPKQGAAGAALEALGVPDDSWFGRHVIAREKIVEPMGPNLPKPTAPIAGNAASYQAAGFNANLRDQSAASAAGRAAAPMPAQVGGKIDITIKSDRPVSVDNVASTHPRVPIKVQRLGPAMQTGSR